MLTAVILEIRTYVLKRSTGDEFVRLMREQALPLLAHQGITVVDSGGSLVREDGAEQAYLVRAFPSLADREAQESAFYSSEEWCSGPREAILARIEGYHTVVLEVPEVVVRNWCARGQQSAG